MKINFSKFKKIDEDEKSATLQHEGGHQLKIAKKGLSKEHQEELDKLPMHLAKGGAPRYAKYAQKFDPNIKGSMASKPSKSSNTMPGSPTMAKNAFTEPQDGGTDVVMASLNREAPPFGPLGTEEKQHLPPCINPSCKSYGHPHPNCRCYGAGAGSEEGRFAEGGKVGGFCDNKMPHQKGCQFFVDGGAVEPSVNLSEKDITPDADLGMDTRSPVKKQIDQAYNDKHASDQQGLQALASLGGNQGLAAKAADTVQVPSADQQAQTMPQAPAPDQQPAAPNQDVTQPVSAAQQVHEETQSHLAPMVQEQQTFENDLNNGHIKPETYESLFGKQDTLGKIGTLFGLLMSGAGSGLSHQPNMVMEMMNNQIKNDLLAQQESVGNRQNFLKINQQNLMNKAQIGQINTDTKIKAWAQSMTQQRAAAFQKLANDTMKLPAGSPQRDQQEKVLAMMSPMIQSGNFDILSQAASAAAMQKLLFGGGNQAQAAQPEDAFQQRTTGLRMLGGPQGEKRAEDLESKHFPGLGQSSLPVSPGDRDQIDTGMKFQRSMKNFIDWTANHSGDLSPSDKREGQALAAQLQGQYRMVTHGGVYKASEADFISKIIDDNPTKFFNQIRVLPQLKAVQNDSQSQMDQMLKDKGFQGYPKDQSSGGNYNSQQNSKIQMFMSKNPNIKSQDEAAQILKKHGYL